MSAPEGIAPALDSLKLALGRLERASTRVEMARRSGGPAPADAMTSDTLNQLETELEAAIGRIDAIMQDGKNG